MMKKILSTILALALCVGCLVPAVRTAEASTPSVEHQYCDYEEQFNAGGPTWDGTDQDTTDGATNITLPSGYFELVNDVDYNMPGQTVTLYLQGDTHLALGNYRISNSTGDLLFRLQSTEGEYYDLDICNCSLSGDLLSDGGVDGCFVVGGASEDNRSTLTVHAGTHNHFQPTDADFNGDRSRSPIIDCEGYGVADIRGGSFTASLAPDYVPGGQVNSVVAVRCSTASCYLSGTPTFHSLTSDNLEPDSGEVMPDFAIWNYNGGSEDKNTGKLYAHSLDGSTYYSGDPITIMTDRVLDDLVLIHGVENAAQSELFIPAPARADVCTLTYNSADGTISASAVTYLVILSAIGPDHSSLPGYESAGGVFEQREITPGSSIDMAEVTTTYQDDLVFSGYTFVGWALGDGTAISGDTYTPTTATVNLLPVWESDSNPGSQIIGGREDDAVDAVLNETTKTATGNIYGTYWADSEAQTKYYVDVIWGDFSFTYHAVAGEDWDPYTHTLTEVEEGTWTPTGASNDPAITVTNHSNAVVFAGLTVNKTDAVAGDLTASFTTFSTNHASVNEENSTIRLEDALVESGVWIDDEMTQEEIDAASESAIADAPSATVLMALSGGSLDENHEDGDPIATVTVTLTES